MKRPDGLHDSERRFHDEWADGTRTDDVLIEAAFEALTSPENIFILKILGNLGGKRLLDIGSGLGEAAIYFAKRGAEVTALDISPRMIELCRANAKRHGVTLKTHVARGEELGLAPDTYDIVYAANLLHHIRDRDRFLGNVRHVLKPGGTFVAWDPVKYNPAINVYRRRATEVRTPDEMPLGIEDLARGRRFFPNLRYRMFWLTSLALFLKYYFIDRKDVNKERYWKAILKESPETIGRWFLPLQRLDRLLLRLPGIEWMAWNMVQWGTKEPDPTRGGA